MSSNAALVDPSAALNNYLESVKDSLSYPFHPSIAAINALLGVLKLNPTSTVAETLSLISTQSAFLLSHLPVPQPAQAGTDLFTRYLVTSLNPDREPAPVAWEDLRQQLLKDNTIFDTKLWNSGETISRRGNELVLEGSTVLIHGDSTLVQKVLRYAAQDHRASPRRRFKVLYLLPFLLEKQDMRGYRTKSTEYTDELRKDDIRVAHFDFWAIEAAIKACSHVLLGAQAVTATGGIINRFGTRLIAELAKSHRKKVFVVVESFSFVKISPISTEDLGLNQGPTFNYLGKGQSDPQNVNLGQGTEPTVNLYEPNFADLSHDEDSFHEAEESLETPAVDLSSATLPIRSNNKTAPLLKSEADIETLAERPRVPIGDWVDFTPARYITAFITEMQGPKEFMAPSDVFEELMKIWMY